MGMREGFEAWIVSLDVGYDIRFMDFIGGLGDGEFFNAEVQGLWTCWQASRATLVLDFTPCNVQHASYNQVDCYSINDVKVIAGQHGVGVRTK